MTGNIVRITCKTKEKLRLEDLTEFQGGLKKRDDADINKIVSSIRRFGFSFPFFVWKHRGLNHVLDGHGRLLALRKLDELGFRVPPLPVVFVTCRTERDARDLLLRLNSQYGRMTAESVMEFIGDFDIETSELELPGGTIDFGEAEEKPDVTDGENESGEQQRSLHEIICPCCGRAVVLDSGFHVVE